jgi:hypothetical protein
LKPLALALAVIAVAALLWGVGELHYRNCIEAAKQAANVSGFGDPVGHRVAGCSRLPW